MTTAPQLRLLCDSNPMCYGSSTAMLSVLSHLNTHATALVRDVTTEILGDDPRIDEVIEVDVKAPTLVRTAIANKRFDAVLVVSNQSNIDVYVAMGIPIFFVDVLYWFGRNKDQPVWSVAQRTFVQRFPGVAERVAAGKTPGNPILVGPLTDAFAASGPHRKGTLAQIGGARSRWVRPGINSWFPAMVVDWLAAAKDILQTPVHLACGEDAASVARARAGRTDPTTSEPTAGALTIAPLTIAPLSYPQFIAQLGQASLYVTAPGQNAVFDGLRAGSAMLLLPPQNATQVAQLRRFEQAGIVRSGLNLPDLDPGFPADFERLTESELTEAVLASLRRLDRPDIVERVAQHLRDQLRELPDRRAPRAKFIGELGSPGGPTVAAFVSKWWRARAISTAVQESE